jgi:aconitate hydratase
LSSVGLLKDYEKDADLTFTSVLELDLSTVEPSVAGPKRPHDFVTIKDLKTDWNKCLTAEVGFKGFGIKP